jgi:hypothetical protein
MTGIILILIYTEERNHQKITPQILIKLPTGTKEKILKITVHEYIDNEPKTILVKEINPSLNLKKYLFTDKRIKINKKYIVSVKKTASCNTVTTSYKITAKEFIELKSYFRELRTKKKCK